MMVLAAACLSSPFAPAALPLEAVYEVTIDDVGIVVQPAANGKASGFALAIRIQETGGLGGNINFFRMELLAAGALVEAEEIAGVSFTAGNRLQPFVNAVFLLGFGFNAAATDFDTSQVVVNITDDGGTVHVRTVPFVLTF